MNKNPIEELIDLSDHLPLVVYQDINQRIADWLESGGSEHDPYVLQQLEFARNFIKRQEENSNVNSSKST